MKIFDALLQEIQTNEKKSKQHVDSLETFIKSIASQLLSEQFYPSKALKNLLDKYLRRVKYPMEVAIVGQFSSGKSTFLNALLSKDILPTGITPVTSKVNFLNYAPEYKLKITFKSGATEYHSIEHLAKFTDQREAIEDVKYLSIYAPVEMLKDISFVDTPGLNSQSKFDTETTNKILRDVDGIIWLGLIDAVAKKTELDILEKYLPNYANKSVCLLNQKDRLEANEVETALAYAKDNYKEYFSKIIAISAQQALDARVHQKDTLLFNEKNRFVEDLKKEILLANRVIDTTFFQSKLDIYNKNLQNIKAKDYANYMDELQESNILEVLEFIDKKIRPKAQESKIFAMKKDLSSLCTILQNEYTRITAAYLESTEIIEEFSDTLVHKLHTLDDDIAKKSELLMIKVLENIDEHVATIYGAIKPVTREHFKEKKSLMGTSYVKEEYQSYHFEDNKLQQHSVQKSLDALEGLRDYVLDEIHSVLKGFEKELLLWQVKTQKIQKSREVASDEEFNKMRYFAAKINEIILQKFVNKYEEFRQKLQSRIHKYSLKNRFELAYEKTRYQIVNEIVKMQNAYEKDSEANVINGFDESEVVLMFKEHLDFDYLKREFQKDDSFAKVLLREKNEDVATLMQELIDKIRVDFNEINEKIKKIDEIESNVNTQFADCAI